MRHLPRAIRLGSSVGAARPASVWFGLLTVPAARIGLSCDPALLGGSGVSIRGRERLGPHRPEFAQPLFCCWLPAVYVSALIGGPPANFHLCRHSPTRHHRQPRVITAP